MIRPLTPADAASYWELRLQMLQAHPEAFSDSYEEALQRPNPIEIFEKRFAPSPTSFTLGAFTDNDQLVGVVTIVREQSQKLAHKANLYAMYVAPAARAKGYAQDLIRAAVAKVQTDLPGVEQINLTVTASNTAARTLYTKLGFQTYGHEARAIRVGDTFYDDDHMVLKLPH
ncbi:GNAT family N-acetyltransferase [Tumebacillus permanentifrigoris]|uniref:RimJ/RimL family protein N-acetyltransferase n=1 Tax=Tumebacillus permanentifrigoris TaxID=378543 RepID=A0A316D4X7_9BACL|nr:GNAT family N-acetyltransferase [Tumebacillus permanentifrigoris]PWK05968.1 RimJ/RimL family protein N-acetyltransferase [Tumebacillus permanentifrigoris]